LLIAELERSFSDNDTVEYFWRTSVNSTQTRSFRVGTVAVMDTMGVDEEVGTDGVAVGEPFAPGFFACEIEHNPKVTRTIKLDDNNISRDLCHKSRDDKCMAPPQCGFPITSTWHTALQHHALNKLIIKLIRFKGIWNHSSERVYYQGSYIIYDLYANGSEIFKVFKPLAPNSTDRPLLARVLI